MSGNSKRNGPARRPPSSKAPLTPIDGAPPEALRTVPQQPRAAATVQRILRAALLLLRRKPNAHRDGIGIEEVAQAANTSIPAVYRYFSSVDDIYTALVQQEQRRILQQGLDLLAQRPFRTEMDLASHLVDFFLAVYASLLETMPMTRFVVRRYHEVSYDGFGDAVPQLRAIMQHAGLLDTRSITDDQIVTALSSLASSVKAQVLRDSAALTDPEFRARLVRMVTGLIGQPVSVLTPTEPVVWTYDWGGKAPPE